MSEPTANRKKRELLNRIDEMRQAYASRRTGQTKTRKILRDLDRLFDMVARLGR